MHEAEKYNQSNENFTFPMFMRSKALTDHRAFFIAIILILLSASAAICQKLANITDQPIDSSRATQNRED
jgi:hypothetical protein